MARRNPIEQENADHRSKMMKIELAQEQNYKMEHEIVKAEDQLQDILQRFAHDGAALQGQGCQSAYIESLEEEFLFQSQDCFATIEEAKETLRAEKRVLDRKVMEEQDNHLQNLRTLREQEVSVNKQRGSLSG